MTAENQVKLQYTFDSVVAHMLTQNAKSILPGHDNTCAYRGQDGKRCGVGFLIPNEKYTPDMEQWSIFGLMCETRCPAINEERYQANLRKLNLILGGISEQYCNDRDFLIDVQFVHDNREVDNWSTGFAVLAEKYSLNKDILTTYNNITIPQPQECQTV